jgi:hypothetical protein
MNSLAKCIRRAIGKYHPKVSLWNFCGIAGHTHMSAFGGFTDEPGIAREDRD